MGVLSGTPFSFALKMKKSSPFELSGAESIKFVPGKARLNDMYLAYMEPKRRGRTQILCLLTVQFFVN